MFKKNLDFTKKAISAREPHNLKNIFHLNFEHLLRIGEFQRFVNEYDTNKIEYFDMEWPNSVPIVTDVLKIAKYWKILQRVFRLIKKSVYKGNKIVR